jgi:hypothetical protein
VLQMRTPRWRMQVCPSAAEDIAGMSVDITLTVHATSLLTIGTRARRGFASSGHHLAGARDVPDVQLR